MTEESPRWRPTTPERQAAQTEPQRTRAPGTICAEFVEYMGFNCGTAVKHLWRADSRVTDLEDLKRAAWHIEREIAKRKKGIR